MEVLNEVRKEKGDGQADVVYSTYRQIPERHSQLKKAKKGEEKKKIKKEKIKKKK